MRSGGTMRRCFVFGALVILALQSCKPWKERIVSQPNNNLENQPTDNMAVSVIKSSAQKLRGDTEYSNIMLIVSNALVDTTLYTAKDKSIVNHDLAIDYIKKDTEELSNVIKEKWPANTPAYSCQADYEQCKAIRHSWSICAPALWSCCAETMMPRAR
jgi:hypothetical protein